jgi:hypothetical protein
LLCFSGQNEGPIQGQSSSTGIIGRLREHFGWETEQGKIITELPGDLTLHENNVENIFSQKTKHSFNKHLRDAPRDYKASGVSPCLEEASEQSNQRDAMT